MSEISTLITNSVESIKRSNSEAVEDQLREIKKIQREEPKSFKRKGNEVQLRSVSICCTPAVITEIALHLTSGHSNG